MKKLAGLFIAMVLMALCLTACGCDHVYGNWSIKTDSTCTAEGVEERTCTECKETEQRVLAMKAHSYREPVTTKAATCTEPGTGVKTCSICGHQEESTLPLIDHSFGEWVTSKAATCTAPGVKSRTCSICGQKEEANLPLIDHSFGEWVTTKAATCTESGELTRTCSQCQINDIQTVPAGHTWNDATCTDPKTCTVCGTTEGEALDHKWVDATYQAPKTCSRCGKTEGKPLVPGVSIGGVYVQLNSAAGAEPFIYWKNDSGKVIKYVTFTAVPYNAVGDIVSSTIGGGTYERLLVTGPVGPAGEDLAERGNYYFVNNEKHVVIVNSEDTDRLFYYDDNYNRIFIPVSEYKNIYRTSSWDPIWYNSSIRKVVVTKIYVEYMDGTTETINDPPIEYFQYYSKYY